MSFAWPLVLGPLAAGEDLDESAAHAAMTEIMEGRADPAQIAAFIVGLRTKGETVDEMVGMVSAMYDAAVTVELAVRAVDTAGTGGDRSGTFNVSTAAALVAAGAGARVAKHGNRAASSQAGSADVLEALGVRIDLEPAATASLVEEVGFGFFFAPRYHPAMRFAAPVRAALGIPTVFNVLGPLANPARVPYRVVGVADGRMAMRMVGVLQRLGCERAFVLHGADGLDEVSLSAATRVLRLDAGTVTEEVFEPESIGLSRAPLDAVAGGDAGENARQIRAVLGGAAGARRDIAVANAAFALVAAGVAVGFEDAARAAEDAIDSGAAAAVLDAVVDASGSG
ncbi:MAG TPA: anthranilate phosphoribosyltransferase [Acidimicrobiia bacterium]|nr:anthranilate phosphoribosyltransferase [Acidimicrobiia bacterium]